MKSHILLCGYTVNKPLFIYLFIYVYTCIILCINWNHSCMSNSSFIYISLCYTSCFFSRKTNTMHYFILQYFSLRFVCIHQVMGELRQLLSIKKVQQESRDNIGSWVNKIIIFLSFIIILWCLRDFHGWFCEFSAFFRDISFYFQINC